MTFNPYGDRNKEELETPDWLFAEVRFLKSRLTFKGEPNPAKFDSVVVVFRR